MTHTLMVMIMFFMFKQIQGFSKIGSFETDEIRWTYSFIQVLRLNDIMTKMLNYDGDYWWIVDNKEILLMVHRTERTQLGLMILLAKK